MLEEVTVRNVGGIADISITLRSGLTAVTGESGTGKSSLVRALELLAGKRGQSTFIRAGEDEASVDAVMSGLEATVKSLSDSLGQQGSETMLYVRRTLSRNGRNRTFLQGKGVPFSLYAETLNDGIRIQSQFAQMELLDPKRQLDIVDYCGGAETGRLLRALEETFREALECDRSLKAGKARRADLEHRFKDGETLLSAAEALGLTPQCDTLWEREYDDLGKKIDRGKTVRGLLLRLTGGASEEGVLDVLERSGADILRELPEPRVELEKKFGEGLDALRNFVEAIEGDTPGVEALESLEREQEALERRMGLLRKLKRSTNSSTVEALMKWCHEARQATEWLREEERQASDLAERGKTLQREASRLAMALRDRRTAASKDLEERVNHHLGDLAMEDSTFRVRLSPLDRIRATGADEVLFTLAVGGREEIPVNKTASGGELSRILLAIQLALPDSLMPPVLVFDEVEAGLGGMAAVLAGHKLLELSRRCQVFLITHEAAIASLAQHHFAVRREGEETSITLLSCEERVEEIARMLSGDSSLAEAREHARRLLTPSGGTDGERTV